MNRFLVLSRWVGMEHRVLKYNANRKSCKKWLRKKWGMSKVTSKVESSTLLSLVSALCCSYGLTYRAPLPLLSQYDCVRQTWVPVLTLLGTGSMKTSGFLRHPMLWYYCLLLRAFVRIQWENKTSGKSGAPSKLFAPPTPPHTQVGIVTLLCSSFHWLSFVSINVWTPDLNLLVGIYQRED